MHMLGIYQARVSKYQLYLTLIPTDVTYHTYTGNIILKLNFSKSL